MSVTRSLIAVLAAAVLLAGGCGTVRRTQPPGPAVTAAVSPQFGAADVAFVRALIPHHRQGVEIARLGAARASRPEARMLASAIVATERDEITRMTGWLATWKQPAAAAPAPDPRIVALRRAPAADFDREFLDLLIAHQREAVRLARTETAAGVNRDARTFARQVDASRTAEIEQLRGYLG